MKKITLFIVCLYCTQIFSQDSTRSRTIIDSFSSAAGSFLKREFIHVGRVKQVEIKVLKLTNLVTQDSVVGLRFEQGIYDYFSGYSDHHTANLDADELDGLIQSLKYIEDNVAPSVTENYAEYNYLSKDYFQAGCFWRKGVQRWQFYIQIDKFYGDSFVSLDMENVAPLRKLLQDVKNKYVLER